MKNVIDIALRLQRRGAREVLIGGDLIFAGSIGRTDFPGSSLDVLLKSVKNEIFTLPNDVKILSGHGPDTEVGTERRSNPFLQEI